MYTSRRMFFAATDAPKWKVNKVSAQGTKLKAESTDGKNVVVTDEPKNLGGGDQGQTPLHLLLSALIGCSQATSAGAARQLKIKLNNIKYEAEGQFDLRGFMPSGKGKYPIHYQNMKLKAIVDTDGSAEQVKELGILVHTECPVAQLYEAAGVQIEQVWEKQ